MRVCEVTFHVWRAMRRSAASAASTDSIPKIVDGAGLGAFLADDETDQPSSTIMSKLDVSSSSRGGVHVAASAEVKLAALIEITQSLGRVLALDEVLPQVLKSLFKIFVQADRGFIVMETPDGKLIPRWVRLRREDANDTLRISRTIIRHVMESKEAILSADAASDERFEMSQSIADFRIRSMMCAPLLDSEGKAFGALQIDTLDQRQRFTKEDLELLVSTASQAAIAIQNAQLHEQALRAARAGARHAAGQRGAARLLAGQAARTAGLRVLRLLPADGPDRRRLLRLHPAARRPRGDRRGRRGRARRGGGPA